MKSLAGERALVNRAHLSVVGDDTVGSAEAEEDRVKLVGVDDDFVATYRLHFPRLVRALELSGASRSTAEDLAQEAFARTFSRWRRVRRGSNPAGYVYRVAFRLARRPSLSTQHLVEDRSSGDVAAEATLNAGVDAALDAMPLGRRKCAVLCLVVGISTKDAAHTLRIAESTVRKQLERARVDLRVALRDGQ